MNLKNKTNILKVVHILKITYGVEIWTVTSKTAVHQLQQQINKTARIMVNPSWYISNEQIRRELKLNTITEMAGKKMETHKNEEIRKTAQHIRK